MDETKAFASAPLPNVGMYTMKCFAVSANLSSFRYGGLSGAYSVNAPVTAPIPLCSTYHFGDDTAEGFWSGYLVTVPRLGSRSVHTHRETTERKTTERDHREKPQRETRERRRREVTSERLKNGK